MKMLVVCLLTMSSLAWSATDKCPLCKKIDSIQEMALDDEVKAYEAFNELLHSSKFSKGSKERVIELKAVLKATLGMLKSDLRQELPDYLVGIEKEMPTEFKGAIMQLSKSERTEIENRMAIAKKIMEKGEEP